MYAHVRYGALAWDDYELLWDSISEDKAKSDEQGQGILPGKFTRGYPPEMSLLPERGGTYAEACTIGTGFGIPVAQSPQKVRYSLHQNPENPGVLLREMRRSFVCNKMQVCEQYHA